MKREKQRKQWKTIKTQGTTIERKEKQGKTMKIKDRQ